MSISSNTVRYLRDCGALFGHGHVKDVLDHTVDMGITLTAEGMTYITRATADAQLTRSGNQAGTHIRTLETCDRTPADTHVH